MNRQARRSAASFLLCLHRSPPLGPRRRATKQKTRAADPGRCLRGIVLPVRPAEVRRRRYCASGPDRRVDTSVGDTAFPGTMICQAPSISQFFSKYGLRIDRKPANLTGDPTALQLAKAPRDANALADEITGRAVSSLELCNLGGRNRHFRRGRRGDYFPTRILVMRVASTSTVMLRNTTAGSRLRSGHLPSRISNEAIRRACQVP